MKTVGKVCLTSALTIITSSVLAAKAPYYSTDCMKCDGYIGSVKKYKTPSPKYLPRDYKHNSGYKHTGLLPHKAPIKLNNVITSSKLGINETYSPANLLTMQPSINEELALLQQRQAFTKATGYDFTSPTLEIGGGLEGSFAYANQDNVVGRDQNLTLGMAEFDAQYIVNNFSNGYVSFAYNNMPKSSNDRSPKSTVYLKRAFISFGDLNSSPVYLSIGKMYVPFGNYSSAMVSTPLTQSAGRILSPSATLGLFYKGINLAGFTYSGSKTSDTKKVNLQGGARLGFSKKMTNGNFNVNASYVTNIADSQGMQDNGLGSTNQFNGFSQTSTGNNLVKNVPGWDVGLSTTYKHFTFMGEYLAAAEAFDVKDLSFNKQAAKPTAMHGEVDINWNMYHRPFTLGAFYGRTEQALGLNLPKQSFGVVLSSSLAKDTIEAIEVRQDKDYAKQDVATGRGATNDITATGNSHYTVSAKVGIYF